MWNEVIWSKRYKAPGDTSVNDTFRRVARRLAESMAEEEEFYTLLVNKRFMPAGRILRSAGESDYMLNCFYVPVGDSRKEIFNALSISMDAQALGGGVGYNFTPVRPRGAPRSGGGIASGPCSFIDIFDVASATISGTNDRKAANIAILNVKHPDVLEFIHAKSGNAKKAKRWTRFNVSVDLTPEEAVGPVWDELVECMWTCGDPGVINLTQAQKSDQTIAGVNPCGEVPLPPYGSCCLGSVVLPTHVRDGNMDWEMLEQTVQTGQRLLTSVTRKSNYPSPLFKEVAEKEKRIGLGVTGYAHALIKMGLKYSLSADFCGALCGFIYKAIRKVNADSKHVMSIAPTGTTSLFAKVSSGIEPLYATSILHRDNTGEHLEVDPLFNSYPPELFETAHGIQPRMHLAVQVAAQAHVDGAVSKTINLPADFTKGALSEILKAGLKAGVKGMTVYRDGSLPGQVLNSPRTAEPYKINTPQGPMRLIITIENGRPVETYILLHKPGGDTFALSSALGRAVSIALQEGTPVERIAASFVGIGSTGMVMDNFLGKPMKVLSVPDAIGKALLRRFSACGEGVIHAVNLCPDCGGSLFQQEGCESCPDCGFTRC